jgi:transcriptional regulator with XRE-family HTH domain
MSYTRELLDRAAEKVKADNESALARALNEHPNRINNYRRGVGKPNMDMCQKLADLLDIPLHEVVGNINAERAISQREKKAWLRVAKAAAVAGLALTCTFPAHAQVPKTGQSMHIMLVEMLRRSRWLRVAAAIPKSTISIACQQPTACGAVKARRPVNRPERLPTHDSRALDAAPDGRPQQNVSG